MKINAGMWARWTWPSSDWAIAAEGGVAIHLKIILDSIVDYKNKRSSESRG